MLDRKGYEALGGICDAAVNLGRWRRALDAVSSAIDAKVIALLIRRPDPSSKDLQMLNVSVRSDCPVMQFSTAAGHRHG